MTDQALFLQLPRLLGADAAAAEDVLVIIDASGPDTKAITLTQLLRALGITATAAEVNRAADTSGRIVSATDAALAVTELAHDGKVIVFNKADGVTATLPAATGSGAKFTFIVGTSASGGSLIIKVADATDVMDGIILAADDTGTPVALVWVAGATADTITLDGSTTGGLIGDRVELIDIAANQWAVSGVLKQSGSEATPFSATVA